MIKNSSRHVLVVDDEPEILAEVADYLRRRGETVVTASSYAQALRALTDDAVPIDILLTDARMPDGDGIELLRRSVGRPGGPAACILMTGHISDLDRGLQRAGIKIIYKPFSLGVMYGELCAARAAGHSDSSVPERTPTSGIEGN